MKKRRQEVVEILQNSDRALEMEVHGEGLALFVAGAHRSNHNVYSPLRRFAPKLINYDNSEESPRIQARVGLVEDKIGLDQLNVRLHADVASWVEFVYARSTKTSNLAATFAACVLMPREPLGFAGPEGDHKHFQTEKILGDFEQIRVALSWNMAPDHAGQTFKGFALRDLFYSFEECQPPLLEYVQGHRTGLVADSPGQMARKRCMYVHTSANFALYGMTEGSAYRFLLEEVYPAAKTNAPHPLKVIHERVTGAGVDIFGRPTESNSKGLAKKDATRRKEEGKPEQEVIVVDSDNKEQDARSPHHSDFVPDNCLSHPKTPPPPNPPDQHQPSSDRRSARLSEKKGKLGAASERSPFDEFNLGFQFSSGDENGDDVGKDNVSDQSHSESESDSKSESRNYNSYQSNSYQSAAYGKSVVRRPRNNVSSPMGGATAIVQRPAVMQFPAKAPRHLSKKQSRESSPDKAGGTGPNADSLTLAGGTGPNADSRRLAGGTGQNIPKKDDGPGRTSNNMGRVTGGTGQNIPKKDDDRTGQNSDEDIRGDHPTAGAQTTNRARSLDFWDWDRTYRVQRSLATGTHPLATRQFAATGPRTAEHRRFLLWSPLPLRWIAEKSRV